MKTAREQIVETLQLWEVETEYAKTCFEEENLQKTLHERRSQGTIWYPLQIVEEDTTPDGSPTLVLEYQSRKSNGHFFSAGQPVLIFQTDQPTGEKQAGTITKIDANRIKVAFSNELADWIFEGKIGIEPDFAETTFLEGKKALQTAATAENNTLASLREILLGNAQPRIQNTSTKNRLPSKLNSTQQEAIRLALAAEDVFLIQGPPGTGKTTCLVELIACLLEKEPKVLVCAPSNAAVDLLAEKLSQQNIRVLRIGNPARTSEQLFSLTLEGQIQQQKDFQQIKKL
ncbi:MAG: AAA family ATPase, partial [Bacteroidia bacterium]|nr:AAA family ATPase [Bacteroidia bacterium]